MRAVEVADLDKHLKHSGIGEGKSNELKTRTDTKACRRIRPGNMFIPIGQYVHPAVPKEDRGIQIQEIFGSEPLPRLSFEQRQRILGRRKEFEAPWIQKESVPSVSREAAKRIFVKGSGKRKKEPN